MALGARACPFGRSNLLPMCRCLGPLLYGGTTVPGMRLDGERLVGSRTIMRRLDTLAPDPPLLPADPALRERVLEAERWGEEVFQAVPRRISTSGSCASRRDGELRRGSEVAAAPRGDAPGAAAHRKTDGAAQPAPRRRSCARTSRRCSGQLERIDGWIAEGLLGGEEPNAADLQIGSTIRLLQTIGDVRPLIDESSRGGQLTRYFPADGGRSPRGHAAAAWLPARAGAA